MTRRSFGWQRPVLLPIASLLSHRRENLFFGLHLSLLFLFEHSFLAFVTACRHTWSRLNANFPSCQEACSPAQQLGPQARSSMTSPTQTHTSGSSFRVSQQRRRSKGGVHLADVTPAFSPCLSCQSWRVSWCSRWRHATETSHHRSLTPAKRLWGSSQVFLTHPVPESHSAAGRLQAFVTSSDRYWMCQTGEQCHSEKGEEGCHTFYDSQLRHASVHWQKKTGTDTTWPVYQVGLGLADFTEDTMQVTAEGRQWRCFYTVMKMRSRSSTCTELSAMLDLCC